MNMFMIGLDVCQKCRSTKLLKIEAPIVGLFILGNLKYPLARWGLLLTNTIFFSTSLPLFHQYDDFRLEVSCPHDFDSDLRLEMSLFLAKQWLLMMLWWCWQSLLLVWVSTCESVSYRHKHKNQWGNDFLLLFY